MTPRRVCSTSTLVQTAISRRGITPKAVIEGPPRRDCAILCSAGDRRVADMIVLIDMDSA